MPPEFPRSVNTGSPVSEKNSSRKLAEQARLPTPRHRIGVRVYANEFPRTSLIGSPVSSRCTPVRDCRSRRGEAAAHKFWRSHEPGSRALVLHAIEEIEVTR